MLIEIKCFAVCQTFANKQDYAADELIWTHVFSPDFCPLVTEQKYFDILQFKFCFFLWVKNWTSRKVDLKHNLQRFKLSCFLPFGSVHLFIKLIMIKGFAVCPYFSSTSLNYSREHHKKGKFCNLQGVLRLQISHHNVVSFHWK